ncbi:MAG: hypothetical protein AAGI30_10620 [Planctomycetota bacterium]
MRTALAIAAIVAASGSAHAVITNGFVETFATGTGGFGSGGGLGGTVTSQAPAGNNPDPSFGGANNGFLEVDSTGSAGAQLATRAINQPQYTGSYRDAGVSTISFWLIDTDELDDAVIRVGIGRQNANFWVSNRSWDVDEFWQRFEVDLVQEQWTQIIDNGNWTDNFEDAVSNANVLQFRADAAIGSRGPDAIAGSFGVDNIAFIPAPGFGGLAAVGLLAAARRRR